MYRKEKRIPSILALFILFFAIGGIVYFDRSLHLFTSSAKGEPVPEEIHFTNVTDSSFTVSWVTATPAIGSVIVSEQSHSTILLDDLDVDNMSRPRTTHYITVKNLKENTSYSVKIISGDHRCLRKNLCPTFTQKTGVKVHQTTSLPPVHGTILTYADKPAVGAIIYLTAGKSLPLSTRTDSLGLWVISFNNLRPQDLTSLSKVDIGDNDFVQMTAQSGAGQTSTAIIDVKSIRQNLTIPPTQIGNSYNFIELASKKDLLASLNNQNTLGAQTQNYPTPHLSNKNISIKPNTFDILFPQKEGETTTDNRPRLRGVGPAGKKLLITINSSVQTAQVIIGSDGTWSWRPRALAPGTHYISIQGYDEKGKLITMKRKFIVLKSGEQVLGEEATPSATLTPTTAKSPTPTMSTVSTPTPTSPPSPTLVFTITPTRYISPTETPPIIPPRAGITNSTFIILGGSASLLLLAAKLLTSL